MIGTTNIILGLLQLVKIRWRHIWRQSDRHFAFRMTTAITFSRQNDACSRLSNQYTIHSIENLVLAVVLVSESKALYFNSVRVLNPSSAPPPSPTCDLPAPHCKKNLLKNLKCYLWMTLPKQWASCFRMNHKYHYDSRSWCIKGTAKSHLDKGSFIGTFDKPWS